MLRNNKELKLADDLFDKNSALEHKEHIILNRLDGNSTFVRNAECYHKTPDGTLYHGHDYGLVSIWKKK